MTKIALMAALLAVAGCAALSNVTPIGDGAYMTVVRSNDVNAPIAGERARALEQARAFCKERSAAVDVLKETAVAPPPGQPPSAELDFRCRSAS